MEADKGVKFYSGEVRVIMGVKEKALVRHARVDVNQTKGKEKFYDVLQVFSGHAFQTEPIKVGGLRDRLLDRCKFNKPHHKVKSTVETAKCSGTDKNTRRIRFANDFW